jgi:uncharacterized protein YbjT (DUF2867 family)
MSILVIGGTGTVGSATVARLARRGQTVRVLSRSPGDATLPAGATVVAGDLGEPDTLDAAFEGIDRLCLITPLDPEEGAKGKAAVSAARRAAVERIVYLSVHKVEACPEAPHFRSKIEIEGAIKGTGIPFVVVRPNNFFQNDLWLREALAGHGVYPQPIGTKGLSRVDTGDIADCLTTALLESGDEITGKTYPVVGPDVLTGEQCARIWSDVLGRKVVYGGDDLDAWAEQAARGGMPDWMVEDLRIMYGFFQQQGLVGTAEDLARQSELMGHPPRRFEDWAAEVAKRWRA